MRQQNIAARMGRWSARHWKTAVFGWIIFVVASVALGSAIGTKKLTDAQDGTGSSGRADRLLDKEFKRPASDRRRDRHCVRPGVPAAPRRIAAAAGV